MVRRLAKSRPVTQVVIGNGVGSGGGSDRIACRCGNNNNHHHHHRATSSVHNKEFVLDTGPAKIGDVISLCTMYTDSGCRLKKIPTQK